MRRRWGTRICGTRFLCLDPKMRVKKGDDAAAGVHCSLLVVADCLERQYLQEAVPAVFIHKAVPGVGIFPHVVWNEGAFQGLLQLIGDALFPLGLAAIAADHRAGGLEKIVDIFGPP